MRIFEVTAAFSAARSADRAADKAAGVLVCGALLLAIAAVAIRLSAVL